jgi:hypothetical protein
MGSFKHPRVFLPLDLQVIEMVYDAAWTMIASRDPFRDPSFDKDRKIALRRMVFALAQQVPVDYDNHLNKVLNAMPEIWTVFVPPRPKGSQKPRAS